MKPETAPQLLDLVQRLGLLSPERLAAARAGLGEGATARALAQRWLVDGWLTAYQVNQLLQGHVQRLVLGQYLLLERLAAGGMGEVYKAWHRRLERHEALKLIKPEHLSRTDFVERFQREIKAAARLSHPNIVALLGADEIDGVHFLAMEYVAGIDLGRVLKNEGVPEVGTACDWMRQAALGLQHVYEHGLVHRDIKPSNLLRAERGIIKILDLGLARLGGPIEEEGALTHSGTLMGTPDYIAPEQIVDARRADIRSDLYSLGCTFYHLLTGAVVFPGGTLMEKLDRHRWETATPVGRPEVPAEVAGIVARLLAKQPEERFQTPAELAATLQGCLQGQPASQDIATILYQAAVSAGAPPAGQLGRPREPFSPFSTRGAEATAERSPGPPRLGGPTEAEPATETRAALDPATALEPAPRPRRSSLVGLLALAVGVTLGIVLLTWALMSRLEPTPHSGNGGQPPPKSTGPGPSKPPVKWPTLVWPEIPEAERRPGQPPELVAVLGSHQQRNWGDITALAVDRAGKRLGFGTNKGELWLWDVSVRPPNLVESYTTKGEVTGLAFAPNGRWLAIVAGGQLLSLDLHARGGISDLPTGFKDPVRCLAFSPDGRWFVHAAGKDVMTWDAKEYPPRGKNSWSMADSVNALAITPAGEHLLLGTADKQLEIRHVVVGAAFDPITRLHQGAVECISVALDGKKVVVGTSTGHIHVWGLPGLVPFTAGPVSNQLIVAGVSIAPDGNSVGAALTTRTVTGSHVGLWQLTGEGLRDKQPFTHAPWKPTHIAFPTEGTLLATAWDHGCVALWDWDGKQLQERALIQPTQPATSLAFTPDGQSLAVQYYDGSIRMWEMPPTPLNPPLKGGGNWPRPLPGSALRGRNGGLVIGRDGRMLASAVGQPTNWHTPPLYLWDLKDLQPGPEILKSGGVTGLVLAPDSSAVYVSPEPRFSDHVMSWNVQTGKRLGDFKGDAKAGVITLGLSHDGKQLLSSTWSGVVRLWDVAERAKVRQLDPPTQKISGLRFSPDGKVGVGASEQGHNLYSWELATGKHLHTFTGHKALITCHEFDLAGGRLVSCSKDKTVRLWEAATGRELQRFDLHTEVNCCAWHPHEPYLAVASNDGTVYVLRCP